MGSELCVSLLEISLIANCETNRLPIGVQAVMVIFLFNSLHLNSLFIISEEHQRDTIAYCGHGAVKTPDIDRLAEDVTLFENT